MTFLKKLKELDGAATAGEWAHSEEFGLRSLGRMNAIGEPFIITDEIMSNDAELICLLRNNAGKLARLIEAVDVVITNYNRLHPDHAPILGVLQLEYARANLNGGG